MRKLRAPPFLASAHNLRITFLLPVAGMSGGVRTVAMISEYLRRRGHTVTVVSIPLRPPRKLIWRIYRSLRRTLFRGPRQARRHPMFEGTEITHHVIDKVRPIVAADVPDGDWVIGAWYETTLWCWALPAGKGQKAAFFQQYDANFCPDKRDQVDEAWRLPIRRIVNTQWLSDLGQERFNTGPLPIVPNGIDTNLFDCAPRRRANPPTLGFMYSPLPVKGMFVLRNAVARIRAAIPALRLAAFGAFHISGECPLPEGCEYHFSPRQEELRNLYGRCDVWLCCSESEGFHLPTHEAMACRCPVVSTKVGGPMDMIEHGRDGFIAPVGNVEKLAEYVLKVLTMSEADWGALSEAGYETARRYTWESSAELFEKALLKSG